MEAPSQELLHPAEILGKKRGDASARYLLTIVCFTSTAHEPVQAEFERLFKVYGVPRRIRSDNGVPFATTGPGGLSPLAIGWIKRGIVLERTDPGHPEQNGAHERMHRTLKEEATKPPEFDRASQQVRFDRFRGEYNELRPHESLQQTPPARHYTPSSRPEPAELAEPVYPHDFKSLRVSPAGQIEVSGKRVQIHRMFARERIGLQTLSASQWAVFFGPVRLGVVDGSAPKPRLQPKL